MKNELSPSWLQLDNSTIEVCREIEEQGGIINEEQEKRLASLVLSTKTKVFNLCTYLDSRDAEIEFIKERIRLAKEYLDGLVKKRQDLLDGAKFIMERSGLSKVEGDMGRKITLRKSTSVIVEIGVDHLPLQFVNTNPKPDKVAIKKAIESGQIVEGCSLVENKNVNY